MIPRLSPSFGLLDLGALLLAWPNADPVARFETVLAAHTGRRHALAFPMARSGLHTLIKVMGWRNRELIVPAYSCAVVPNVILATGNVPRFVDIDRRDFNMRPDLIEPALGSDTVAVIATHMYGFPMDLEGLASSLAGRDDVVVLQDCALALGTEYAGRAVCRQGLAAMLSFSVGKQISTVEGGALVMDDDRLYAAVRAHREQFFRKPGFGRALTKAAFFLAAWLGLTPTLYPLVHGIATNTGLLRSLTEHHAEDHIVLSPLLREHLPPMLARLGINQMGKAAALVARRTSLAQAFRNTGRALPGLEWPEPREGSTFSHCPVLVDDRGRFLRHMRNHGVHVGTEVFDYALPDIPVFAPYADAPARTTRDIVRRIALVPNHPRLGPRQVGRIKDALRAWGMA